MNYRQKIYSEYVSKYTSQLYGEINLGDVRKQFPVWDKYYGEHLPKNRNINILEIGCGNGGFLYYLRERSYKNCFGIDISEEQIELAKKLGVKNVEQVDLREFLRNKKEVYNVIFARDVLEHFRKDEILDSLELIYSSLLNGGKFIIQSPNAESLFGTRMRYGDFTHEVAFTRTSLSQILRVIGFSKIEFYPTEPVIHGIRSFIRFILWKIIELKIKLYLLIESGSPEGIFTQNLICVAEK